MEIEINIQVELISLTGVVHRICRTGIYTNNIFRPFERPIPMEIDNAGTSSSGSFIFIITHGKLFIITVFQSELRIDLIEYFDKLFFDAAFNNEENILIALGNDSCLHLFEIYPPIPICHKFIDVPKQPFSFKYFQLQNIIEFNIDDTIYAFKYPNLFDSDDPPNLEFIPSIPFEEIQNLLENEEEEEEFVNLSDHMKTRFQRKKQQALLDLSKQVLQKGQSLSEKQISIQHRYDALNRRIEEIEANYFDMKKNLKAVQEKLQEQAKKAIRIICSADEYGEKLLELSESLESLLNSIDDIICDDDVINQDQEIEFRNFNLLQRIHDLSNKLSVD